MSQALEARTPTAGIALTSGPRLGPRSAFALQVSILVMFLAAASAPTPLYAVYQPSGASRR